MFDTPILLITFNRPKHAAAVLAEIKKQKPKNLYVFQDGPRANVSTDFEKCAAVQKLIQNEVDWDCNFKTLYHNENLGCGYGPVKAISWLFENEEIGIILEDDCLPGEDFFRFCEETLELYKNEEQVWMVSGMNRMERWRANSQTHFFSKMGNTWGWASYRRAWNYFDHDLKIWFNGDGKKKVKEVVGNKAFPFFENDFNVHCIPDRKLDVWDYHWHFARIYYGGLSVIPSANLMRNIGTDSEGTHTINSTVSISLLNLHAIHFPIKARIIKEDKMYNKIGFERFMNPIKRNFIRKVKLKMIRIIYANL